MGKKQAGFTLIELVVVIVILAILAAVALPRYSSLQREARIAKLNGAHGAVAGAMAMTHGACLAISDTTPTCSSAGTATYPMRMEGAAGTTDMVLQYPTANQNGIVNAAGITLATADATQGYAIAGGGAGAGDTINIQVLGGGTPGNCSFNYTAANGAPGPTLVPAAIGNLDTSGC